MSSLQDLVSGEVVSLEGSLLRAHHRVTEAYKEWDQAKKDRAWLARSVVAFLEELPEGVRASYTTLRLKDTDPDPVEVSISVQEEEPGRPRSIVLKAGEECWYFPLKA